MNHRLLFVDDEKSLLNGIERRLAFEFDLDTAESGQEGLDKIQSNGPYAVVFTDMRMPKMDGVQFLEKAHEIAPDSVYVMLTGNNDQTTAIRALNEGRAFRFLNKPCDVADLKRAVEDGFRQYDLVQGEKELLHKTFVGAVKVLTDVVDIAQPELGGRGEAIASKMEALQRVLGVTKRWEYALSARLSTIGLALASPVERTNFTRSELASKDSQDFLQRTAEVTGRLIGSVPRLETVASICSQCHASPGEPGGSDSGSAEDLVRIGSVLLRASILWDSLHRRGIALSDAARQMALLMPGLPAGALQEIEATDIEEGFVESVVVPLAKLAEGMVLGADAVNTDGSVLIRRGRTLNNAAIEKLRQYKDIRPVEITLATAEVDKELSMIG